MSNTVEVFELMPGAQLLCLKTDKFKTGCMYASFLRDMDADEAPANALLMPVIMRGTEKHPDISSLSLAMDGLYGADFGVYLRKKAETQVFGIASDFVDDRFSGGEEILPGCVDLMRELLLESAGGMREEYFTSEKQNLADAIRASMNDKHSWTVQRAVEIMCPGEPYSVSRLGTPEKLESVTIGSLRQHRRELLSSGRMLFFYGGSRPPAEVYGMLGDSLGGISREKEQEPLSPIVRKGAAEKKEIREHMEVTQAKLCMGWRFRPDYEIPYAAGVVFSALFGGTSTSKLFLNVREKLSLCYSIDSSLDRRKGIMLVSAGVDAGDLDRCTDQITEQLAMCARGEISQEEMENARAYLKGVLRASGDSLGGLQEYYTTRALFSLPLTPPEDLIGQILDVSAEDVAAVAAQAELDTVYSICGQDEEEEGSALQ